METKKSIVTKVTKFDKKDSYGNYSFLLEFKNGDRGYYNSKDETHAKFTVGIDSDYSIDEKVGKTGNIYYKITAPGDAQPFVPKGGRPQVEPKIQMISFAMSYCKDLIVAGKVGMQEMDKEFNRIYSLMTSKL